MALWETELERQMREERERQQELERQQSLRQQLAALGLNFAQDNFSNQLRLQGMQTDIVQQQIQNQRYGQNAAMDTSRMMKQQADLGNIEATSPFQRATRMYNY